MSIFLVSVILKEAKETMKGIFKCLHVHSEMHFPTALLSPISEYLYDKRKEERRGEERRGEERRGDCEDERGEESVKTRDERVWRSTKNTLSFICLFCLFGLVCFRVIGPMQNSISFAEAFSCSQNSYMNPPIKDKCVIW